MEFALRSVIEFIFLLTAFSPGNKDCDSGGYFAFRPFSLNYLEFPFLSSAGLRQQNKFRSYSSLR